MQRQLVRTSALELELVAKVVEMVRKMLLPSRYQLDRLNHNLNSKAVGAQSSQ